MYNQRGSYDSQFSQGPPPPPPRPPAHLQQQPPPHVSQPMYQHGLPPPSLKAGVRGSTQLPQMYPCKQQNSQFMSQNMRLPPPPPRHPSHEHTFNGAPFPPPPQHFDEQGLPPPLLLSSSLLSPLKYGSFMHSASDNSHSEEESPPPPKPAEEKVVQKIEDFCRCIVENGHGYEETARRNEGGNPEFEFLFGGQPGSDVAIAHEYFQWLKKKNLLRCNSDKQTSNFPVKPFEDDDSKQQAEVTSHSPADSDMEMEDDITQPEIETGLNNSTKVLSFAYDSPYVDHGLKVQLQAPLCSATWKEEEQIPVSSHETVNSTCVVEGPEAGNFEKTTSPLATVPNSPKDLAASEDDSAEEGDVGTKSVPIDTRINMSVSDRAPEMSSDPPTEVTNGTFTPMEDVSNKHKKHEDSQHEHSPINYSALEPIQKKDSGNNVAENDAKNIESTSNPPKVDRFGRLVRDGASDSDSDDGYRPGRRSRRGRSSSRSASPPVRRKRSRSRSRSRSRRSPRRWRDERSRSRSWSPRRRRSRSRSPRNRNRSRSPRNRNRSRSPRNRNSSRSPRNRYRSRSPFRLNRGVDSVRRVNAQTERCYDFTRGRCHRGSSCRYLHNDPDKNDGSNRYKTTQKHVNIPSDDKNDLKSWEVDRPGGTIGLRTDAITCIDVNFSETAGPHQELLSEMSPGIPSADASTFKLNCDESQQTDNSSLSESSPVRKSALSPTKIPPFADVADVTHPPYPYGAYGVHLPNSMPRLSSGPPYMLPNQNSNFNVNSSWAPLPPPPRGLSQFDSRINPPPNNVPSQFQPNYFSSRNDFGSQTISRPYITELPIQSQITVLHHQTYLPSAQEPHRPVSDANNFISNPSPMYAQPSQQFGSLREERLVQVPMQGLNASSSYPWANSNPQSMSYDYHNNHASTLQHPPSMRPNTSFGLSHAPVDGNFFGSGGSNLALTSPNVIEQNFPRYGGNQYDPLSDSVEVPLSNSSQKVDNFPKLEFTSNYDSANKPLDMEENNLTKDDEHVDAEVGSVENESLTDPGDDLDMTAREIEIDEMLSKESKESRSMKHFKVAVASFVKEVLKPSWRQGNMSKEAFKTIVKKTVDKVSGAMKGRHAPKSKAKIDQYIDSQQRKLTKLVMGYIEKYVKQ